MAMEERTPSENAAFGYDLHFRGRESQLEATIDAATDGIITLDERGNIKSLNSAAKRLFAYPGVGARVKKIEQLIPSLRGAGREMASDRVARMALGRRRDGSTFPLELSVSEVQRRGPRIIAAFVRDMTEQRHLETDVLEISDREQQRIGQDLHDSLGQQLTAVRLMCHSLQNYPALLNPTLKHKADRIAGLLSEAIRQTRALSHGLAPLQPGSDGLVDALRELARITSETGVVKCTFHSADQVPIIDGTVAGHLYRIAQEAVNNATKHGNAREITIEMAGASRTLGLRISDNGKGMPEPKKRNRGRGLEVMNYRANVIGGFLTIHSLSRKGMTVTCNVPLKKP